MRKLIVFSALIFHLLLSSASLAAPSEALRINKAKRNIERAERTLGSVEKLMARPGPLPPSQITNCQKKIERTKNFLSEAETILAGVSGGSQERTMLQSARHHLADLQSKVAASQNEHNSATALATGSSGQQALSDYQNLADSFRSISDWLRGNSENPKMMTAYREAQKARAALDQKYASVVGMRTQETFPLTAASNDAKMAEQAVKADIQYALKNSPAWIEAKIQEAKANAKGVQSSGAFGGWETSVEFPLRFAKQKVDKLVAVAPDSPEVASLNRKIETAVSELESTKKSFRAQVIAANKMPKDAYKEGDASAIKAAIRSRWAQKFPGDRVAQVIIKDSQWSKFSGTVWVDNSRSWRRYNFDRMKAFVRVTGPGSHDYKFLALVVRENLQGGRIDILSTRPDQPENEATCLLLKR